VTINLRQKIAALFEAERSRYQSRQGGVGRDIPLPSQLGSLREHRKLPQRGPAWSSGWKCIWCIWARKNASDDNEFSI